MDILVVEDDWDLCNGIAEFLEDLGYRVGRAYDGRQALDLSQRGHPRLILLDLMLPGMSGWEVARALRAMPPLHNTPVVVITAMPNLADEARRLGAVALLEKPFTLNDLVEQVRRCLPQDPPPRASSPD
ncbi:MAG TPA: response regulator [Chloroflexota bacterium]|jgi:CheY-like chemotaxis protein